MNTVKEYASQVGQPLSLIDPVNLVESYQQAEQTAKKTFENSLGAGGW